MRFDHFKHDITFEYLLDLIDRKQNFDNESAMYVEWAEHFFDSLADSLEKILNPKNEGRYYSLEPNVIRLIENKNNQRGIVSCTDLNELKHDFNFISSSLKKLKENSLEFYKSKELEKTRECISKYIHKNNSFY
jgi:hypothetical protein